MSFAIACFLCGAAGSRQLFLSILTIFLLMFTGSAILLVAQILNGDWTDKETRFRPLEAEREALRERGGDAGAAPARIEEATRG